MKQMIEKLFYGGNIYTLKTEGDMVEAICVNDGVIVFAGSLANAREQYQAAEEINLDGGTMIPGMGDGHLHFYAYCQTLTNVDLGGCKSKAEAIERLKAKAEITPEGQWIRGSNFDQSKWNDSNDLIPTYHDLDKASTKHPIVIKRVCLHTAVANSAALAVAGIDENYVAGPGGTVEMVDGKPNGILREQCTKVFDEIIPDPMQNEETKRRIMKQEMKHLSSLGITMIHTYAADIWKYIEDPADYEALDKTGDLTARVSVYLDKLYNKPELTEQMKADPNRKVQYGGFKLFSDGSLGSRSAKLYEPYADDPTTDGILVATPEEIAQQTLAAAKMGLQPAIHAIGDLALEVVLDAIEYTIAELKAEGWSDEAIKKQGFRIIHAQLATDELIARMARLPVIIDAQPSFYITDMHWIEDRIGPQRMKTGYLWQTYIENGLLLTGSSDAPVESFNPIPGIYSTVARKDLEGWPEGGLMPEEKTSVYDAVCMFSKNIPYATGDDKYVGTLEQGKFADMTVLDRNIFEISEDDILNIKIKSTYLAGKETYKA